LILLFHGEPIDINNHAGISPDVWYFAFSEVLPQYNINTPHRIVAFLAQCAHESNGFNTLTENLHYSAQRLLQVFPRYFDESNVNEYAGNPVAIGNRIYANRMGNGSEESGDGYKYSGKGIVQLTGKENYTKCSQAIFQDDSLVNDPTLILDPFNATHAACWFWESKGLNELADEQKMKEITRRINGGYIGLQERVNLYNELLEVFEI